MSWLSTSNYRWGFIWSLQTRYDDILTPPPILSRHFFPTPASELTWLARSFSLPPPPQLSASAGSRFGTSYQPELSPWQWNPIGDTLTVCGDAGVSRPATRPYRQAPLRVSLSDSPPGEQLAQPGLRCHSAVSSRRRHRTERRSSPIPLTTLIREGNRAGPHEWKSELQVRVLLPAVYDSSCCQFLHLSWEEAVWFTYPEGDILLCWGNVTPMWWWMLKCLGRSVIGHHVVLSVCNRRCTVNGMMWQQPIF